MKKLLYLFLTVLIVACSGEDSNNNNNQDNNDGDNNGDNNDTNCEYVLNTLPVTNAIADSATFNGIISIDSNCEFPITEQGFVYATTIQPTIANNKVNVNGSEVTTTLENLEPNTTYYVRTFLTNVLGDFYGNEVSFISNNAVYLDDNGITIKAYDFAEVGDTGVINGITYTVVDEAMLREMVENEQDVTKAVTTKVTNMSELFFISNSNPNSFNQPIGNWDVSNVTSMRFMFRNATSFNQDISNWDVSNVFNMQAMFQIATSFNQPIGSWDVSNVINMNENYSNGYGLGMFLNATSFNQDISNWDVSGVADMTFMFGGANSFNQPIGNWDVSSVNDMSGMFLGATSYNQDIGNWDVSNVNNMNSMFNYTVAFNQNLSSWSVNGVTDCTNFSNGATSWTLPQPNFTNCTP